MTVCLRVYGVVQGVGFRPFVARLAQSMGLQGWVCNNGGMVEIRLNATPAQLKAFTEKMTVDCPAGGLVARIESENLPEEEYSGFFIATSGDTEVQAVSIPPDLPLCPDCERELADSANRRYRYPFISCVACGPRYSIVESLPYDRPRTVMVDFPLCDDCQAEYTGTGRRRHAQTISCHRCGPQLLLRLLDGSEYTHESALQGAIARLQAGGVLAVKGIGGYHLVCTPFAQEPLARLRALKQREQKPFAVMYPSLAAVESDCIATEAERALLSTPARPIVLLPRRASSAVHPLVYGQSRFLGAFLPYTPLQRLLLDVCGPLVFTSANRTEEPIIYEDTPALALLGEGLDGVLYTTRRIVAPLDDSVAMVEEAPRLIRRSRGYVPGVLPMPLVCKVQILATGSDLKATLGYYREGEVLLSQPLGDLQQLAANRLYSATEQRMRALFALRPTCVAADLHPGYYSTRYAQSLGLPVRLVQHHHAHIASVMAEHQLRRVLGVAFDGTGWGTDQTVWGGEFLLCEGGGFQRLAHLRPVTVCGYDHAARDARLLALFYAIAAGLPLQDSRRPLLEAALREGVQQVQTSSMGRLFDVVSALLGLGEYNHYEGECAILLENAAAVARQSGKAPYPMAFALQQREDALHIDPFPLLEVLWKACQRAVDRESLALGFHMAVADMLIKVCSLLAESTHCKAVALSGGVFVNRVLLQLCLPRLRGAGFTVYLNEQVPSGDGGVALGQLYVAALQLEEESACV